jgi:hypothetical protein
MSADAIVNPVGFGLLLSSLYMLRFRAWRRPVLVVVYFAFFTSLEWIAARHFMPPGALPNAVGYLCLFLSLPVLVATVLVWRQEQREHEGD